MVREPSDPLTSLVKRIDQRLEAAVKATQRRLGVYVIFDSSVPGLEQRLKALAEKEKLQSVNLCIGAVPRSYEVSPEADVTVVIYSNGRRREQRVTANFALRKGELSQARSDEIFKALANVLPATPRVVVPTAMDKAQDWRFTLAEPKEGWFRADFDDRAWKSAPGGFGDPTTPGAIVRTAWRTNAIWLRRVIDLPAGPYADLQMHVQHDDDAEIYLNGVLAAKLPGCTTSYKAVPISEAARKTLRPGANLLAVYCLQTSGGQYIDVGLMEWKR